MLEILDTAGTVSYTTHSNDLPQITNLQFKQEQFTAMRELYMRNMHGFVLVYSIICPNSFAEIRNIHAQLLRVKDTDWVPLVIVGNKSDMESHRLVSREQGEQLAKEFNCSFFETSAKTRVNIDDIFCDILKQVIHSSSGKSKKEKRKHHQCALL